MKILDALRHCSTWNLRIVNLPESLVEPERSSSNATYNSEFIRQHPPIINIQTSRDLIDNHENFFRTPRSVFSISSVTDFIVAIEFELKTLWLNQRISILDLNWFKFAVATIESSLRFLPYRRIIKSCEFPASLTYRFVTYRRQIAPRSPFPRPAALPWGPVCVCENKTPEPSGNSKMARLPSVNTQFWCRCRVWKSSYVRVDILLRPARTVFPSHRGNRKSRLNVHGILDRPFYSR